MSNWFSFATWQPAHYYVILGRRPCFFRGGFNSSVVSIAIYYILQCRKTDESLCCMLFHNGTCPTQKRRAHPVVIISFLCCYCWTCFTCAYWWWRNRPSSSLNPAETLTPSSCVSLVSQTHTKNNKHPPLRDGPYVATEYKDAQLIATGY